MKYFGCIDLGGTNLRVAFVTENGFIQKKVIREIKAYAFDKKALLEIIVQSLHELINKENYRISKWVVAVPCVVTEDSFSYASNLTRELSPEDFRSLFAQNRINETILFVNDVHAAAMAELGYGQLRGIKDGLYVNVGTGLSCVIVTDSKVYRGHNNAAGEIAYWQNHFHTSYIQEGYSTLEGTYSGKALEEKISEYISNQIHLLSPLQDLKSLQKLTKKDDKLNVLLSQHFRELAVHFCNMAILLNPQKVVLGGGVANLKDVIYPVFCAEFAKLIYPPEFSIVESPENTGLRGAAFYALNN